MELRIALLLAAVAGAAALYPSTEAPGGLTPDQTPQFILFTHDDALRENTYEAMLEVTEGRQSLNGCPATATMFTTTRGTDCELVADLYSRGYEISGHTVTHPSLNGLSKKEIEKEIVGARSALVKCGIPEADVVGHRSPYLETKPEVREVLEEDGFLYDSTLIEEMTGNSLSGGPDSRIFPWNMTIGIPINCAWYKSIQSCTEDERHNLWQVPLWPLNGYTMDYGDDGKQDVFDILKANFDAAYKGNRAPLPIFIHTPWLERSNHLDRLKDFADYALSKPDVYFVTVRQLLAWMQKPIPAEKLTPLTLGCGNAGGAGPVANKAYSVNDKLAPSPAPSVPAPAPGPAEVDAEVAAPAPARRGSA
ncbi:hypothetical protein ABPG77_007707 [Micractinium sp. CCAP 211/92]